MALLNTLKLVSAKRPNELSPQQQRRAKLIKQLTEQIEWARAVYEGASFERKSKRKVRNEETGERVTVEAQKKVKAWWWEANGKVQLAIRYGNKVLPLSKNTNAVELESTAEIVPTLTTIKQAAEAGELDSVIESVTASIVRKPK